MTDPVPTNTPPERSSLAGELDWRACARGALVGLAIIVPTTVLRVVLDREIDDFDNSGWVYPLFVLILVGYFAAGWVAARARPDTPLMHGGVAGIGVLVAWIPIRILIWVVRDEERSLLSGRDAALRPGQIFGHLLIAATLGMLGGVLAARRGARSPDS